MPPDRWLAHLRAPDVTRLLGSRSILVQPLGAIEQHGPHLPLHTDRLVIDIPWASVSRAPDVGARLTGRDGTSLAALPVVSTDAERARIVLPLLNLAPGTYVVRVDATAGDDRATQQVAFTVSQ